MKQNFFLRRRGNEDQKTLRFFGMKARKVQDDKIDFFP